MQRLREVIYEAIKKLVEALNEQVDIPIKSIINNSQVLAAIRDINLKLTAEA